MQIQRLALVSGLLLIMASGPVSADDYQARHNTCDPACRNAAEAMAKQQTTETDQKSSADGTESSSKTSPSYSPLQVLDFLKQCCSEL